MDFYLGGELIGGVLGGSALETDLLKQRNYSPTLGGQINLSIRFFDVISLESGIGQHWSRIRMVDNDFEEQADEFSINIKNSSYHWNYHFGVAAFYPIKKTDSYLYGRFGLSFNHYGQQSLSDASSFQISSLTIDRSLEFESSYEEMNYSFIPEIGVQHKFFKGNLLSLGLRYNMGQSTAFKSTYTISDNVDQSSKTDGLVSNGDAFTFTLRFDYNFYQYRKNEKSKRIKLKDIALDLSKKDTLEENTPKTPTSDRKLVINDHIKVKAKKVKVQIWDHQTVDGDRVSLNLNGKWILEDYTLKKEKYEMEIELEEGINTFILHALNLGDMRPNTAALIVDDGNKKHRIILQSNMKKSGTLEIKYKP